MIQQAAPESVAASREALAGFEQEWEAIDASHEAVEVQVDYRLVGCALARVRWELDHVRAWERNADFYVDQTLGAFYDVLLLSTNFMTGLLPSAFRMPTPSTTGFISNGDARGGDEGKRSVTAARRPQRVAAEPRWDIAAPSRRSWNAPTTPSRADYLKLYASVTPK